MPRTRSIAILVALAAVLAQVAVAAGQPSSTLRLELPAGATPGTAVSVQFRLPGNVSAVDGRVFVDRSALEVLGIAPLGAGKAMAPVEMPGGFAVGAYGLRPSGGQTVIRLVVVPLVSARIGLRLMIDSTADANGRRVALAQTSATGSLSVGTSARAIAAPPAQARLNPQRAAAATRGLTGRQTLGAQDMDEIAAAWEFARLNNAGCGAAVDAATDANADGCVDIVDVQAVLAGQGRSAAPNPSVPFVTAVNARAASSGVRPASTTAVTGQAYTATFTVTHTGDGADSNPGNGVCADANGRCTLRAAMQEANWSRGEDLIQFNLTGTAPVRITLTNVLPHINDRTGGVTIDGYSQPGARVNSAQYGSNAIPGVELVGTGGSPRTNIFRITSAGNVIRGFAMNTAYRTIAISGADANNNRILGNWIGFTGSGALQAYTSANVGIWIENGASNNRIGTPDLADRNVIGRSTWGIDHYGPDTDGTVVQNNIFCMSPSGARALCSTGIDFNFGQGDARIGGFGANEKNVFGPTRLNGVEISHGWDPDKVDTSLKWVNVANRVEGNWIGFRIDGSYNIDYRSGQNNPGTTGDNGNGVNVYDGCKDNIVDGNWIASAYDGVNTMRSNCTGTIIRNNLIGESPLGQAAPIGRWGVNVRQGTTEHLVQANTIRNAAFGGVGLSTGNERRIRISRNIVTDTSAPAIVLTPAGGSSAPGSNNMYPSPVVTSATTNAASGTGNAGATVEVFRASRNAGQSGLPVEYLGTGVVANNGTWTIPITVAAGERVTALQIAPNGNTSMLGTNVTASFVAPPPAPVANFSWAQQAANRTVNFTDTSTNTPTSWSWNFGDGGTSTQQNPAHTYAAAGTYSVVLVASNGGGSDSRTRSVTVTDPSSSATYAADAFGRTVNNGWGTSDLGGNYNVTVNNANYSVGSGVGRMVVPGAGGLRSALLGASAQDVDIRVRVSVDKVPAGGAYWVYLAARRNGNNEYRPKIKMLANGSVTAHAGRVLNGSESSVAPEVTVAGLNSSAGGFIWVRAQVTGTGTTTIRVKAWADGQAEPAGWQFSATDTSAALQAAGTVGLRAYIGGKVSTAPVTFTFDDYSVAAP